MSGNQNGTDKISNLDYTEKKGGTKTVPIGTVLN